MKMRIKGSSLRLRLTQKEVALLRDCGRVEALVQFSLGHALVYLLEGSSHAKSVTAVFDGRTIRVAVPEQVMTEWAQGDGVSIEGKSEAGLQLLIEKDFQCLHKPGDRDAYPHPLTCEPDELR